MEEPDYDDLIEDFMEDYEEPPAAAAAAVPEYDEDFLAEIEAAEATTTKSPGSDLPSPISKNLGGRLAAASPPRQSSTTEMEDDDEAVASPAAQVRRDFATSRSRAGDAAPDIYSFERYNRDASWRQENQASPSTMRAREWKAKSSRMISSVETSRNEGIKGNSKQATTPESQLLQYNDSHQRPFRKKRIARTDRNMTLQPIEGEASITMTLGDGNRVFVRQSVKPELPSNVSATSGANGPTFSLGISMTDLMRRVQAIRRKKEHDKLKLLSKQLKQQRKDLSSTGEEGEDDEMEIEGEPVEEEVQTTATRTPDDQLWVDKHAPSSFSNLLSDERTNREVLRALREWDPYVFKKDPPPRPKFGNFQQQEDEEQEQAKNPHDKRPKEKNRVILLSGSPGVGKTTLAHILARHCGYRPMEVNGSDERSATALTERVLRAMETATLDMTMTAGGKPAAPNDWKGRPNCIILDEIDGADAKQALKALVELIREDMPAPNTAKEGKKRSKKPYLKRPIIFICNNLYAPALRPLLPFARLFTVEAPSTPRLVARLRAVLSTEGLSLWGGTRLLNDLVRAAGGDIRSCLYTLQFASAQVHQQNQKKGLDISKTLQSALNGDGLKDDRTDVAGTTMTVFKKLKKKGKNDRLWGTKQMSDPRSSVERVFDAVESFGEHGKILDCMYLNLLNVSYIDPTFDRCATALQWLSGADNHRVQHVFTPCVAAALHLLCRVEQKPELTYSNRRMTENKYQLDANVGLTHKFTEGLSVKYRGSRSADAVVRDTIPYALWMLSAGEGSSALSRPATSVEILKKGEQLAFHSHTGTLRSLGLSYVPALVEESDFHYKNDTPQTQMVLEPPIERLVQFQDLSHSRSSIRKEIPVSMKELLAQQAALQGIRESKQPQANDPKKNFGQKTPPKTLDDKPLQSTTTETEMATEAAQTKPLVTPQTANGKNNREERTPTYSVDEHRPTKKPKLPTPISSRNFLGVGAKRAREARSSRRAKNVGFVRKLDKASNSGSGVPFRQVVRLKYVKGFTQAVRNPCRLEDLA